MSEPIEFPLNFERYMEMGQKALEEEQFLEAFINFEAAYNLKEDSQANLALVKLLMARSDFSEAKRIADEMRASYFADPERFALYLKLLLGNQEFIKGRKLLLKKQLEPQQRRALLTEIEQGEQFFQTFQQKERLERISAVEQLADQAFFQQAKTLQQLEKLPQTDYLAHTLKLLATSACHILLRHSLLESLVELGYTGEVQLEVLTGEIKVFDVATLPEISGQLSYQGAASYLITRLEKSDSDLNRQLQEELRLHFSFLYPLADQLVQSPALWVELFLKTYLGTTFDQQSWPLEEVALYQTLQKAISAQSLKMTL